MSDKAYAGVVLLISVAVASLLVLATQVAPSSPAFSIMAQCTLLAFTFQWLAFIPAYIMQTERYYDLTGGMSFIVITFYGLYSQTQLSITSILLAAMVLAWSARLGTFLFKRIVKDGSDNRFAEIKPNKYRFFSAWTLQGLWVVVTSGAALTVITSQQQSHLSVLTLVGALLWLIGFSLESVADWQKFQFKHDPKNKQKFIQHGLWAYSRHPNYFGEIILWFGVALAAYPALQGWQHVTLISPFFVTLLLTKISGIPLLEDKADQRWGTQQDYQAYKTKTPVLVPRFRSGSSGA
ncbi:DUF1295 domain-containing protein [Aliiglaciecola sp. LCG003]|uniref:DUF1295 domain-containing protein n=1 Tax=Aliiglaciecola sp. LCG003 TaxID=3053655 RepID=UPI0025742595|nr:DUF1295 domain-containing protein [Aliiglaciecola sp. LCG003]WJG10137.1 DUF1295 domain-containing protein [Aliiglaciecola sp. LCG003]